MAKLEQAGSELAPWQGDTRSRLRSALVADSLDSLGYRNQCLSSGITALQPGTRLVGRAFPVQIEVVTELPAESYVGLLAALADIEKDDVFVSAVGVGMNAAIWGELVTAACVSRGAVGAVVDGFSRDTAHIRDAAFPVFSRGSVPTDSNGRSEVRAHNVKVTIDGVEISPGDLIVGDDDGIAVIPVAFINEVVRLVIEKDAHESEFRSAVNGGMGATEAFVKFGVL